MHVPKHFEETRIDVLHAFIRAHPFATLITLSADGLEANHLPLVFDSEPAPLGTLRGHVARANPVWQHYRPDVDALAVFHGPHAYISPGWYPSKRETGKVVPTWNYVVVHAHGPLRVVEDRAWLRSHLETLTAVHEVGRDTPWKITDAPADYIDTLLGAVVGIEIPIAKLVGKWKLGQNRPARDRAGAIEGLLQEGNANAAAIAELMRATMQ